MADARIIPVVLSGGSGTRLWPVSREKHPKQLQPLLGDASLLQDTLRRLEGLPLGAPIVVSNQEYRFITAEQLRLLGLAGWTLLLEPVGRNTAPALTAAALHAVRDGADPVLLATPADHHVRDAGAFRAAVLRGLPEAEAGAVVTFGIQPDRPETGYGYIETKVGQPSPSIPAPRGAPMDLLAFREKPDTATAQVYVAGGRHFWNSGIFMLRASVWLKAIGHFAPAILAACRQAVAGAQADGDFVRLDATPFAASPADSIDYAVMEKLPAATALAIPARVVPLDVGWSDVGAWDALWQAIARDADDNAVKGDVWLEDSRRNLVIAEHGLVACMTQQNRTHHRRHRPGRRLPRRVPAEEGLRGARHQAPHLALQHRPHRPSLPGPAGAGAAVHPALRRHDRFVEPRADHPAGAARRDLQPRGAEPRGRELRGARVHRQLRCHRPAADPRSHPHPRAREEDALLSGVDVRAVRPGAGDPAEGDHALLPAQPLRRGQALRLLDHGELPRGLRHVRLQRHPVQPRIPAARRDLRHAQDHAGAGAHQARPAGLPVPRQHGFAARLGPRA
jgi:mannose-1-phosphate guanylyltransferase/mannose-6-phosphate isomerase